MPNATALHQDDRMMAVFAKWRGRQLRAHNALLPAEHLLETERGKVMAFIDNDLSISAHASSTPLAVQTLKNRNINRASRLRRPAPICPIPSTEVQENRKTLATDREAASDAPKSACLSFAPHHPGGNHGLSEGRSPTALPYHDEKHRRRLVLIGPQLAMKSNLQRRPGKPSSASSTPTP